jgi:lipid A 4'-phosphatase
MSAARRLILASLAVGMFAAAVFLAAPELDLRAARVFYRAGEGFVLQGVPGLPLVTRGLNLGAYLVVAALALALVARMAISRIKPWVAPAALVYLIASVAIGPGLVTNVLLKDQFGRARPKQVVEFGGTRQFTPPLVMTDQCARNCSFVAGDPSMGFTLIAVALAFPARRRQFLIAGFAAGGALGLMRMGQGEHFLSDVIFSGVFNTLVFALLYELILARR